MGIGPEIKCNKCGRSFFGGKGFNSGAKNFCHDCVVNMAESISEDDFNSLGGTQKGFIALIRKEGGLDAGGGKNWWINILKKNAGEIDEIPVDTENDANYIMDMLEKFRKTYKNSEGNSLLLGGYDSYTSPDKVQGIAEKYHFVKHKSFHTTDKSVLEEIKYYIEQDRQVAVVAWSEEHRIDLWLEREEDNISSKSDQDKGGCFIATAVYGSYDAPEVVLLRGFRDTVLSKNITGRTFIHIYYSISPFIAKKLNNHSKAKEFIRNAIIDKIVAILR